MILIFHRRHARTVLPCAAVRSLSTYRPTELLRFDEFHFLFSHSTLDVSRRESVDIARRFAVSRYRVGAKQEEVSTEMHSLMLWLNEINF